MLSTTNRLLTAWKYDTGEIAHMGMTNQQVVLFLKRNIAHEQTRVKNISRRYPASLCVLDNQS